MSAPPSRVSDLDHVVQSFIERQRQGERPSVEDYLQKHPELAAEIKDVLPLVALMEEFGSNGGPVTESKPSADFRMTAIPMQMGEYRILREIGRGGMGVVYEAIQEPLGRHVALKVLPQHVGSSEVLLERFRREAQAAARLHHTNIVPVFGVGEHEGISYYAMQFIPGQTLDAVLHELRRFHKGGASPTLASPEAPLSAAANTLLSGCFDARAAGKTGAGGSTVHDAFAEKDPDQPRSGSSPSSVSLSQGGSAQYFRNVAEVGVQVADALAYAHGQGVVHRDIKPSNLMLDPDGSVWLMDFGLAKTEDSLGLTLTGDILGTLRYIAPEQLTGMGEARSDVYGLGLTLYELTTLQPALDDPVRARLIDCIRHVDPAPPRRVDERVPRDLETIILKATAKEPARRYQTAMELASDLRRFLADRPIRARRASMLEHAWRWRRRNPVVAGLVAFILMLLISVAIGSSIAAFSFQAQKTLANQNEGRALAAEADAHVQVWRSKLEEARSRSLTRRPGQRLTALSTLHESLSIARETGFSDQERLAFRNVAIGCLTLPDLTEEKVWDALPDRMDWAFSFDFDADFRTYACSDATGAVHVRAVKDDRLLATIPGEGSRAQVVLSPNGLFVAVSAVRTPQEVGRWRMWRLGDDGKSPLVSEIEAFSYVAFHPDSKAMAFVAADHRPAILDLDTGEVRYLPATGKGLEFITFSPDGRFLGLQQEIGGVWTLEIRDVQTGDVVAHPVRNVWSSAHDWQAQGRLIACGAQDRRIHLVETTNWKEIAIFEGHQDGGIHVAFEASGEFLLSNDWQNLLRVWDLGSGAQLLVLPAWGPRIAVGKEHGRFAVGNPSDDGRLRIMKLQSCSELLRRSAQAPLGPYYRWSEVAPAWSNRDQMLAWSFHRGGVLLGVSILDGQTGQCLGVLGEDNLTPVGFEPDGALVTAGRSSFCRWPRTEKKETLSLVFGPPEVIAEQSYYWKVSMSADGTVFGIPRYGSGFGILHRGEAVREVRPPSSNTYLTQVQISPDGRWAVSNDRWDDPRGIRIWNARTAELVKELPSGGHVRVGFSPDGRWLWSAGGKGRIWSVSEWAAGPAIGGHAMAISPDSRMIASGDGVDMIRLANLETGEELARLRLDQNDRLHPQRFSSDGSLLYVWGQQSETLFIWNLRQLRQELAELDLDWNLPPFPPLNARPDRPLRVTFDLGPKKAQ